MKTDDSADPRHELKFVVRAQSAGHLETWLRTCALGFVTAFPDRVVNNLYFDSVEGTALAEKLAGVSRRAKVRYRWYGEPLEIAPGRLEIKHRHNGVGWKETFAFTEEPPARGRAAFVGAIRRAVPAEARPWLDDLAEPTLITRYRRSYYVSADGAVRATVDRDLEAFDQRLGAFPRLHGAAPMPDILVLELKFARAQRARVVRQLGELALVASACSKFELGMRAVAGT
ncbi:MAG: polyphosphate polymerase domain-containing protein [Planctomycetota bacterium]